MTKVDRNRKIEAGKSYDASKIAPQRSQQSRLPRHCTAATFNRSFDALPQRRLGGVIKHSAAERDGTARLPQQPQSLCV